MRTKVKLGDLVKGHITNNQMYSAIARGLQFETLYSQFNWERYNVAVKFLGSNTDEIVRVLTPLAGEDPTINHFEVVDGWWDDGEPKKTGKEYDPQSQGVSYYDMILIGGEYWCFAPCYYEALSQIATCPILTFEEAEAIENRLLAS